MCGSYPFCSAGLQQHQTCFFRALDVFQILRDQFFEFTLLFLASRFNSECISWWSCLSHSLEIKWHGRWHQFGVESWMRQWRGWGLWTYLRWVDRWWLGPAGHWLTLTLSHFSNTEWMDVVAAIHQSKMFSLWLDERHVFGRQWRPSSARTQPSSVWTWRNVKSVTLGWRPGRCNVVVFCCSEGLPCWRVQGLDLRSPGLGTWNEVDYSWGCWEGFLTLLWQVTVFDSAQYSIHHAQGLVSSK